MAQVLRYLPPVTDPNVLVGTNTADDAAVYKIREDLALVQTVDFFTPVVDDPYIFGQIAAANSFSDIYAMGAQPTLALNIAAFPSDTLPLEVLAEILKGGAAKAIEAGVSIVGGHTIQDAEPKYGMSVTGWVHPDQVISNGGAKPGDVLVLTKPLGLGILTTAMKGGLAGEDVAELAIEVMTTLNKAGAEAMAEVGVHSCTDITGFGLLGHFHEMLKASGVSGIIQCSQVQVLEPAWEFEAMGLIPSGTRRNLEYMQPFLQVDTRVTEDMLLMLADTQTSGGLLIAVDHDKADKLLDTLKEKGVKWAHRVGQIQISDPEKGSIIKLNK